MSRTSRGCGCAAVILALICGAAGLAAWKFGLVSWLRTRPPRPSGAELQVHVLDVGPIEGDSILIISPAGKNILIDAGDVSKGKVVLDALKRYKVEHLDYFIATHPHPDHIGGAAEVLKSIKTDVVVDNGVDLSAPEPVVSAGKSNSKSAKAPPPRAVSRKGKSPTSFFDDYKDAVKQSGAKYEVTQVGKKYDLGGGAFLTVLAPAEPFFTKDQMKTGGNDVNANSIVMRLDYGDFSMLFMGDAEAQSEQRLLSKDLDLKVSVIKIAHHGSKYATSENFVKRVRPEAAIISDGAWNRYGHPAQAVLDRLKAADAKVYRTDLQGEISITSKGKTDAAGHAFEIKVSKETKDDVWAGREGGKDDSSRSGFIAYGDFGPPPKPKTEKPGK
jgi:competence protein ComEC